MNDNKYSGWFRQVEEWLDREGYPLEYQCASAFQAEGLRVFQGTFAQIPRDGNPKQIDVVADATVSCGERFLRISTVVECCSSAEKPIIIFTDPFARMAPEACIAQTIGSDIGDALMWLLRGEDSLKRLAIFATPEIPGFTGRQAFSSEDTFYQEIDDLVQACSALVTEADRAKKPRNYIQDFGLVTFPTIVIDSKLLEASYNSSTRRLELVEVSKSRIHWRGSGSHPLISTIDVITLEALPDFARERASDCRTLLPHLATQLEELVEAFSKSDRQLIFEDRGPTGRGRLPRLLALLLDNAEGGGMNQKKNTRA